MILNARNYLLWVKEAGAYSKQSDVDSLSQSRASELDVVCTGG